MFDVIILITWFSNHELKYLLSFIISVGEKQLSDSRNRLIDYQFGTYIKLDPYVNDVQGFFPYIKELKSIFKFKIKEFEIANKIVQTIENTYIDLKRNESMGDVTIVSIHVRLTDYKRHLKKLFNLEPIPAKWFSTAMNYFNNRYQVNLCKV